MDKGCVLVLSVSEMESSSLIKEILQCDELPKPGELYPGINAYSYRIDNKYYTNEILLCTMNDDTKLKSEFVNAVHAIVIHYDPENEPSFNKVKEWIPFAERHCPEIRLLLCSSCNETSKPPISKIRQWCAEQKFCLFELKPDEDSGDDDDDYPEPGPIEGINKSLQAYMWPNSDLKVTTDGMINPEVKSSESRQQAAEFDPESEQSFESLFQQFAVMKVKAQTLTGEERKDFAEEVVKLFWHSIGGDEDELDETQK